ncbi:MAG: NAD(P)H-hydrate dehydratase [Acidobacteria bacterium]|nr:NAD(P)H-hydrate dehydratase [Acidobacteriota bacterium]MCA1641181.1 NAD(P)H-hydrate dehydratase [Acidobacteriota bacterium]
MLKIVSAAEMREIDRLTTDRYSLPSMLLMEAAASAAARAIASHFPEGFSGLRALVLCGRGNNGGDGAALARLLCMQGARVEVALAGQTAETRGDARINFEIARELSAATGSNVINSALFSNSGGELRFAELTSAEEWERCLRSESGRGFDLVVDALLGTGLARPLEGLYLDVVKYVARCRALRTGSRPLVVSLDIPSGLDADSADATGEHVRADLTVTFTAPKLANVLPPASHSNGRLAVADIGTPAALVEESGSRLFLVGADDARAWLVQTRYAPDSFKNTHGHALIVAGSRGMTGAAVLCSEAAMRSGAGLVTVAAPSSAVAPIASRVTPEVMTAELPETERGATSDKAFDRVAQLAERADVIAVGPGLTTDDSTRRFVRALVERRTLPIVIDADALNALAPWSAELRGSTQLPLVVTPHVGEMRRLLGVGADDEGALKDRVRAAREFATAHELIVVLKGSRTLVAAPDGRVFVNPTGNAGLGTAGAGDTLTGVIAGFIAQARGTLRERADVLAAVLAAVYVGGLAGDLAARARGMRTMIASDISRHLADAVRALDPDGEQP